MPHKLHERALRLHIADVREWTETSNPWSDRPDAFLMAPIMVRACHALIDALEYLVDTLPAAEAWDEFRRILHEGGASVPEPLVTWPCTCAACRPELSDGPTDVAVRYLNARTAARAMRDSDLDPGDARTAPIPHI
jgi:hypothetical protein